jgi:hypothetical protein
LAGSRGTLSKPKADRLIENAKMMKRRELDAVDPFRYIVKKVSPLLLNYFDGDYFDDDKCKFKAGLLNDANRKKLFNDVQIIFAPERTVDKENIESILREKSSEDFKTVNAGELYEYIEKKTEYDPSLHFKLIGHYQHHKVCPWARGCAGFGVVEQEGKDSPMGRYYTDQQIAGGHGGIPKWASGKHGLLGLSECVEKCKLKKECKGCTIGGSLVDWYMIMNSTEPLTGKLTSRATYGFGGAWIKEEYSNQKIPKFSKNTKSQEYARMNKEIT